MLIYIQRSHHANPRNYIKQTEAIDNDKIIVPIIHHLDLQNSFTQIIHNENKTISVVF